MKKVAFLVLLAAVLTGCDDFPLEGGGEVLHGHGHGHHRGGDDLVQQAHR